MTASAGTPSRAAAIPAIPLHRRLYGFGSIYGKTIRDSRLAFIVAAGLLGGMALVMGAAVSTRLPDARGAHEVDQLVGSMPASMVNLFGNATAMGAKIGTLGGYMTFKYGAIFASARPCGRSSRCPGRSPARRAAAASTWWRRRRSASDGSRSRRWPPT